MVSFRKFVSGLTLTAFLGATSFLAGCGKNPFNGSKLDEKLSDVELERRVALIVKDMREDTKDYLEKFVWPTQSEIYNESYFEHGGRGKINGDDVVIEALPNVRKDRGFTEDGVLAEFYDMGYNEWIKTVNEYDISIHTHLPESRFNGVVSGPSDPDYELSKSHLNLIGLQIGIPNPIIKHGFMATIYYDGETKYQRYITLNGEDLERTVIEEFLDRFVINDDKAIGLIDADFHTFDKKGILHKYKLPIFRYDIKNQLTLSFEISKREFLEDIKKSYFSEGYTEEAWNNSVVGQTYQLTLAAGDGLHAISYLSKFNFIEKEGLKG